MSPQTAHTHPDWEQNADSFGNAGSVLCSRNRYPRARGKLPESTEISGPHRRSERTTRALESRRAAARRKHWRILGWIFFREEHRRVQINARRTGRTVTLRTPSAGVPDVPQTQERGFADATIVIRKRSLKPFLASLVAQGVPLSGVSPVGITKYFTGAVAGRWKRAAVSFYVQSLRSFCRYASSRGWCVAGIAESIDAPRLYTYENLPQGPSWEDVKKLLASVSVSVTSPVQIRSRCAILLCSVYGFRVGEV